jgi:phage terminase large subunit
VESYVLPIRAGSASPDVISYLNRHGLPRVIPAVKGGGLGRRGGVEFLQSFEIVVHRDCAHTIDELSMYSYKIDPKTDEVLPILADKDNHLIDRLRYAVEWVRQPPNRNGR